MKWIHRLRSDIDNGVQSKGSKYFRTGAVEIEFGDRREIRAVVNDKLDYRVEIRLDDNAVVAFCDCAPFIDGAICEHIWAALLSAESLGHLSNVATRWDPYIENGLDAGLDDGDLIDDDELISAAQQRHDRVPLLKEPAVEPWKQHLSAL